jgi:hypothetical protein
VLESWLKWWNTCLAYMRPWVQTLITAKKYIYIHFIYRYILYIIICIYSSLELLDFLCVYFYDWSISFFLKPLVPSFEITAQRNWNLPFFWFSLIKREKEHVGITPVCVCVCVCVCMCVCVSVCVIRERRERGIE